MAFKPGDKVRRIGRDEVLVVRRIDAKRKMFFTRELATMVPFSIVEPITESYKGWGGGDYKVSIHFETIIRSVPSDTEAHKIAQGISERIGRLEIGKTEVLRVEPMEVNHE